MPYEPDYSLVVMCGPDQPPRREVRVFGPDGHGLYRVRSKGAGTHDGARVSCSDEVEGPLHEFLLAWWDAFVDAGWPMDSWFLVDCTRCTARSFQPCRAPSGRAMKGVHTERCPDRARRPA